MTVIKPSNKLLYEFTTSEDIQIPVTETMILIINTARKILQKHNLCKKAYARNVYSRAVFPENENAVSFCLYGSLERAIYDLKLKVLPKYEKHITTIIQDNIRQYVYTKKKEKFKKTKYVKSNSTDMAEFNDLKQTTKEDVLAVLKI